MSSAWIKDKGQAKLVGSNGSNFEANCRGFGGTKVGQCSAAHMEYFVGTVGNGQDLFGEWNQERWFLLFKRGSIPMWLGSTLGVVGHGHSMAMWD